MSYKTGYGLDYYIIPKLLTPKKNQEIYKLLEDFRKNIKDGNLKVKKEYGNLLSEIEDDVFAILAHQGNFLNNNIYFMKRLTQH